MRPSDFPANPAVRLLTALSVRHDRAKPGSSAPTLRVDYGDATSSEIDVAERLLIAAEKASAITIERPKRTPHVLYRIRLADAGALATFLDRRPAAARANLILDRIAPLLEGAAAWIQDEIESGLVRWSRGDRAFRIEADDPGRIEDLIRLLLAVDRGVDGRDGRTFSSEAGVDSKAFERHRGTVVQIARRAFGWDDASEEEVMTRLGFRPFFQLIHVAGPIAVPSMRLDASNVVPFIGIPPQAAGKIELVRPVAAVLTIENLASFNRHTREAGQRDVAVVYTGGFPSRPVVETLRRILDHAPKASLHHWGDIDQGGVRIFRNVEERVDRRALPHLMDRSLAERHGRPASPTPGLGRIAQQDTGAADLALYLSKGSPRHLEQELVAPKAVER